MKKKNFLLLEDQFVLLIFSMLFVFLTEYHERMVFIFLLASILLLFSELSTVRFGPEIVCFVFLGLSTFYGIFGIFLPVAYYGVAIRKKKNFLLMFTSILLLYIWTIPYLLDFRKWAITFLLLLAFYLSQRASEYFLLFKKLNQLRKSSLEKDYTMEIQTKELIEKQDSEIKLVVSDEQNRIARDIHDNVGHLLSSALLQIGALQTLNQGTTQRAMLDQLKVTIEEGMDNIRESVHNLHDDSLDLEKALIKIQESFHFCPIEIQSELNHGLDNELKLTLIMLIREALANVMKHSNATFVKIELIEHPGFYKFFVQDNGTKREALNSLQQGIGLSGMKERAEKKQGRLTFFQDEKGFSILAIFQK